MSISEKIEEGKLKLIESSISNYKNKGRGLSDALKQMTSYILKMKEDNISLSQQIALLESVLDVEIKYDTYKKWYARWIKKRKNSVITEVQKLQSPVNKNKKKSSCIKSSGNLVGKKTPKVNHNPVAIEANLI